MTNDTINNLQHPVQHVQDKTSLTLRMQNALGFAVPPVVPWRDTVTVKDVEQDTENPSAPPVTRKSGGTGQDKGDISIPPASWKRGGNGGRPDKEVQDSVNRAQSLFNLGETYWQCPTTLKSLNAEIKLPFDPVISISGKNIITRRYTAKGRMRGSIKEWWSMDDWDITLSGVLMDNGSRTVDYYQKALRSLLEHPGSIYIINEVLNDVYDIRHIAVESYDFPFTKGIENQAFSFKAYSDGSYSL